MSRILARSLRALLYTLATLVILWLALIETPMWLTRIPPRALNRSGLQPSMLLLASLPRPAAWAVIGRAFGPEDVVRNASLMMTSWMVERKGTSYPVSMDFFTLFSLPRHLHIDTAALEKAFYAQSRKLHPDRFAAKPQAEQDTALAASSQLNDAYRTLRDPIARTEYVLSLEGVQMEEQSRAATDAAKAAGTEKKQVAPPDLLEEAFELNMALEELKMGDDPDARAQLESEREKFTAMLAETQTQLEKLWSQWDAAETAQDADVKKNAVDAMVALLNRRSYIRNLVRDVNAALE